MTLEPDSDSLEVCGQWQWQSVCVCVNASLFFLSKCLRQSAGKYPARIRQRVYIP